MIELIPALFPSTEEEFRSYAAAVNGSAHVVQLDIADGVFVSTKSWYDPTMVSALLTTPFELHLMVENPLDEIKKWNDVPHLKRLVVHYEAIAQAPNATLQALKQTGREVTLCLNENTPTDVVAPLIAHIDAIQCMGVVPGAQGQALIPHVVSKIRLLRSAYHTIPIAIDGGVNEFTMSQLIDAGATRLCVGSAIFKNNKTPKENIIHFEEQISSLTSLTP